MDAPTSVPTEKPAVSSVSEVDLFADAAFVSAEPHADKDASSQPQVRFHHFLVLQFFFFFFMSAGNYLLILWHQQLVGPKG